MIDTGKAEEVAAQRHTIITPILAAMVEQTDAVKLSLLKRKACQQNGVSRRTLRRWLSRYFQGGFEGLKPMGYSYHKPGVILRRDVPNPGILREMKELAGILTDIADVFRSAGYCEAYVLSVQKIVRKIIRLHAAQNQKAFNSGIVTSFISETEHRFKNGGVSRSRFIEIRAIAEHLIEFSQSGRINSHKRRTAPLLPDCYEKLLDEMLKYEKWGVKVRKDVILHVRPYFSWLVAKGCNDISQADSTVIREYFIEASSRMTGLSIDSIRHGVKKMYSFAFEKGYTFDIFENTLSFKVAIKRRIMPYTPQDELSQVLSAIDRNSKRGKREYAIYLLLAVLGLRGVDVVSLTFDCLDWRSGEIKIIQSKTSKSLALPLTTDVGEALRDYILNARPQSTEQWIFLSVNAPFAKMDACSLYSNYQNYRRSAGLPTPSPMHGIRRSIATNMIIQGIPATTVAQVLGHSTIDSTKQYVSLDSEHLIECALDFAGIAVEAGGETSGNI